MVMEGFAAHLLGNLLIVGVLGLGTVACFVAAIVMLVRPGEKNENHPKYLVLHDDDPGAPGEHAETLARPGGAVQREPTA